PPKSATAGSGSPGSSAGLARSVIGFLLTFARRRGNPALPSAPPVCTNMGQGDRFFDRCCRGSADPLHADFPPTSTPGSQFQMDAIPGHLRLADTRDVP